MVEPIKPIACNSVPPNPAIFGEVKKSKPTAPQTELISDIEKARLPTIQKKGPLKEETDYQAKKFVEKSSLYTSVCLLHSFCNDGPVTQDADRNISKVVKELSKQKSPGFFSIRKAMNKYFPQLSFFRMFFLYFSVLWWLPKFYIERSIDPILEFSRTHSKDGNNLPILGSNLLGTMNTYLADYNRTVQRFRDCKENPLGDRDGYVRQELHKPELLGYPSIDLLHKDFAKAASRKNIRPAFRGFSDPIKKLQFLDFVFLTKTAAPIRTILLPITFILGIIPYLLARVIEFIPNKIIKKCHPFLIKYFTPTVMKSTLDAVSKPGFSHAINSFLCDVIQDLLIEMKKKPEERSIEEIPNVVNEALSKDIRKFSELVYALLKNEPYKTQEELQHIKEHGPDPKSFLERLAKLLTSKGYLDRSLIDPTFVDALHANIIEGFNLLFSKPERLEEYLCKLIVLLNTVFEYDPDPNSEEGKALLEEMTEKQNRREQLVNEVIKKGINLASDDYINSAMNILSRNQKENILVSYRKILKKASDNLPEIAQDSLDILHSSGLDQPNSSQIKIAEVDIDKTMRDLLRFFTSISNLIPHEDGPVKSKMEKHLKPFLESENALKNCILQIKDLHDQKDGLKTLTEELQNLKHTFASTENSSKKILKVKELLRKLNEINKKHQFDHILLEYKEFEDQLKKIDFHKEFSESLQELLTTTFFSNNLIHNLAKAQKDCLLHPNSESNQQALIIARNKVQNCLRQIESNESSQDVLEIKLAMKKLLDSQHPQHLEEVYKDLQSLVRKKIAKHKSLHRDEQTVLPKFYETFSTTCEKQILDYPNLTKVTHKELIKQAEILKTTVEKMQLSLGDIQKQSYTEKIDTAAIAKLLSAVASIATYYLGFFKTSIGLGLVASRLALPGIVKRAANSIFVPLAKSTADNAYGVITNQPFYEGLIHAYMRQFIDYQKSL